MPSGYSRQPRAYLLIGGVKCVPIDVSVSMSSNRNADTFGASLPLSGALDERYFADTSPIPIEIMATNDQQTGRWSKIFSGLCDVPAMNFATRRVMLTGRDLTSRLIETKTTEKWLNKTSAEIVKEIAGRVGLTADVSVPNSDKAGLIYKDDYNKISNQDVLWNVLTALADREGCAVFVKVDRLVFKPFDELDGGDFEVLYERPTPGSYADGSFINLSVRRNLAVAKNVRVSVKTWQQKQKKVLSSAFRSKGASTDQTDYTYRIPNSTKENADKFAKNKLAEITAQERLVEVDMPGDVTCTPENKLVLSGTNTGYDQSYIISGVSHSMSQSGYRMTIHGRAPDDKNTIEQES